jgi:heme A synthase
MAFLLSLHGALVWPIWVVGGMAALWGAWLLVRKRGIDQIMRYLLWGTAGLGILQGIVGGLMWLLGCTPHDNLHYVYGLLVLAAVPVAVTYADNKSARRDMIVFVVAVLVVVAAAVRAFMTGPGGVCVR